MLDTATKSQRFEFQAEVKQLLDIVVNSLYTDRAIFLRELVANASDALDKLRLLSLTDPAVLEDTSDLAIYIELDPISKTLTISDNGIGMSYDEVVENIGTIAKSGSANFMSYLGTQQVNSANLDLIGQFGVGFYSVFMVAEKVTLLTRRPNQQLGVKWESTGDGSYEIEETVKAERGTKVILKLKEFERSRDNSDEDFLDQYTIQRHIQKHCNFISYPIRMNFVVEEPVRNDAGAIIEGETSTLISERILNSIQPIWEKEPKDLGREEYVKFYKQQFHDWNEPAEIIHCKGEGQVEFTALFFIPSQAPYGLYTGDAPKGPQLYCKHVLVMDNCRELLPDYLSFMPGIVDSPDLSLNISREMLQHSRQLQIIKNHLEKKILESFKAILRTDRKKYEGLWSEYGKAIKGGIFMDHKNTEKLQDLLIFNTSSAPDQQTTLREYVERMPAEQKAIYYVPGESQSAVERLPHMEAIKERGIEVLYFLDKVDEFLTQHLREYDGKKLQSVSQGEIDLGADKKKESDTEEGGDEQYKDLLEFMQRTLGDKVKGVQISKRLRSSPVCLVSGQSGYSLNMERLMREANQPMFRASRILELNPEHQVIKSMRALLETGDQGGKLPNYCHLLYEQALLIENEKIEDPVKFANAVAQLIVDACH